MHTERVLRIVATAGKKSDRKEWGDEFPSLLIRSYGGLAHTNRPDCEHNRVRSRSRNSDAIQITRCCYGSFIARQWIRWIEWNLTARKIDSIVARNARDFLRFRVYRGIYSGRLLNFTAVAVHQG